jgi:ribonuclease BN (tRNA processing enzyme)
MIVMVLGTASGFDQFAPSSSFLVDEDTLLDCGSGVETLPIERLLKIQRLLLTHAHLDHCGALPHLLACHAAHQGPGVTVYCMQETMDSLKQHMFNGQLSPDYSQLSNQDGEPLLRFFPVEVGDALPLPDGIATALPAQHNIPAIGWLIEGPWRALAYTGDTGPCPAFWHWAANVPSLSDVICEVTYNSKHAVQAETEGHMTPALLRPMLELLPANAHLWISHLDSKQKDTALSELRSYSPSTINIAALLTDTCIDL